MAEYTIEMTEEAKGDLDFYAVAARRTIVSAIRLQVMHEPLRETRNRKPLRDHPLARWELRVEQYRVFYDVDQAVPIGSSYPGPSRSPRSSAAR